MSRRNTLWPLTAIALMMIPIIGCGSAGNVDAARASAEKNWKVSFDWEGSEFEESPDRMDIYIVDPDYEDEYPETFEISGDGVTLVGSFPMSVRVGYGEELENLVGKTVAISPQGGDYSEPSSSSIRLMGMRVPVSGGSMTFEKLTGKWAGSEGDRTLWGTVELRVSGADGERTVRGAFAVHAVTWG